MPIDPRGLGCASFCAALRAESGLGEYYGRKAYRALMLRGSAEDPGAYRDGTERDRVAEAVRPFLSVERPAVRAFPSPGALKFASTLSDGLVVESVILANSIGRSSICLSVQAGCKMGCAFCATGALGFARGLSAAEIVEQVLSARREFKAAPGSVVLMGMGEPLDAYDESLQALRVLADDRGLGMPISRMTLSTAGLVRGIERLAEEPAPRPNLALSLHAADDELRSRLMPINRQNPLERLKEALGRYARKTARTIFIEYLLLGGVNDAPEQARALAAYLRGLPVRINLLSYNESGVGGFTASTAARASAFKRVLVDEGYFVHDRYPKGSGVQAACGQLGLAAGA